MLVGFIITGFIIGAYLWLTVSYYEGESIKDWFVLLWLPVVGAAVAGTVGLIASLGLSEFLADEAPVSYNVVSMGDAAGVDGQFFLGSGSVDTQPVFFYYNRGDDGSYGLYSIPADNARIVQDDSENPRVEITCTDLSTAPKWVWWPVPPGDHSCNSQYDPAVFYVPENSIKTNFNLDAQ